MADGREGAKVESVDELLEKFFRLAKGALSVLDELRRRGALASLRPFLAKLLNDVTR